MKRCVVCKLTKSLNNFNENRAFKDGLQGTCRECQKKYRDSNRLKPINTEISELYCNKCSLIKSINNFKISKTSPRGYDYWCNDCRKLYRKRFYKINANKISEQSRKKRQERVEWFQTLKRDIPCKDCGKIYEPYCMDFDHIKGQKIKSVSRMVLEKASKEKILEEIKKCELVCILCHNYRTHIRIKEKSKNAYRRDALRNINIINQAKSKPCVICNIQYETFNMQLDHINPEDKYRDVCQLKHHKKEILLAELKKCQVVCALCHRRKSIEEQRLGIYNINRVKIVKKPAFCDIDKREKECSRCHEILPFEKFPSSKITKIKLDSWCFECYKIYKKGRRALLKQKLNSEKGKLG